MKQKILSKIMGTLYKTYLVLLLLLFGGSLMAQESLTKTIHEEFKLDANGELHVENKYGNVKITGWEQSKVKVNITVKVNHKKEDNAKDLLNRVRPEIRSNQSFVSITSLITNRNTGWFADFFNKTNPIDTDRSRVQIDYEVYVPKEAKLNVKNKFGDILIEDWKGELEINLEHGDLWLGETINKANIQLKFGKIRAKSIISARIALKNGELNMDDAKKLQLTTEGSEIQLNATETLELYSNKDEIHLEEVTHLFGSLKFSSIRIEQLQTDIDTELKIVDFVIGKVNSPNATITLTQESSDIAIKTTNFSHRFLATLEQGVVRLPKSYENVVSKILDKGKKLRKIEATYGNKKQGTITISGVKGIVTIND
ncbi:hypothetical protein [Croceivirga sp. JEA036]|uniref:hypothetical protein n=1 Tax=Croceivirga sp. JEA036 TaxID=2721162 RepID=UPI00143993AF|nr:hypothetical protein [Croceivirga sp. JEA036]NJB35591.1 hypothetical protein [Croceivirga sp. JEA036]